MAARARRRRATAALTAEQRAEQLSPAAQRRPVLAIASGSGDVIMLRGPRVERTTHGGFVRSSPIRNLWARGRRRQESTGDSVPHVTDRHLACAERLLNAWNLTAEGISLPGGFDFDRVRGTPTSGYLSPGILAAVNSQIDYSREWRAARQYLGPAQWDAILNIALLGRDVKSWAHSKRWHEVAATGYLIAALDRLVDFYSAIAPKSRARPQSAAVVPIQHG